jgi:hypothetical protein
MSLPDEDRGGPPGGGGIRRPVGLTGGRVGRAALGLAPVPAGAPDGGDCAGAAAGACACDTDGAGAWAGGAGA